VPERSSPISSSLAAAEAAPAEDDREALIRKAVASANTNALRMALYQATRDADLLNLRMERSPVRGGAQFQRVVARQDLPVLQEKAVKFLLDPPAETPPPPTQAEARQLIALFSGEPLSENYARFGLEELAFAEFPRDWQWTNKPAPEVLDKIGVLVVGGGISGLTAAIQLKRLGLNFKVIERQADIGGTWHLNDYPEARVDTSSYMYQYKFEKNYPWTEFFASRNETKTYLKHIANKSTASKARCSTPPSGTMASSSRARGSP
jgi:4-hydroxyacetophenone monooxygenase